MRCIECKHIFVNPIPDDNSLRDFYIQAIPKLKELFPIPDDFSPTYLTNAISEIEKIIFFKENNILEKKGKVLDIGFGKGGFLLSLKNESWDCTGLELTDDVALLPGVEGKFKIFYGADAFNNLDKDGYDIITLWHVLEHLSSPVEVLSEAQKYLRSDGKIIVAVPNYDSLSAKLFKKYWYGAIPPWHLHLFTPRTVSFAMAQSGFVANEIRAFGKIESHLLWIESFTNIIEEIPPGLLSVPKRFFYRIIRKFADMTMTQILRLENFLGIPSAIIVIGEKNPLIGA